jgi:hypothetical protein
MGVICKFKLSLIAGIAALSFVTTAEAVPFTGFTEGSRDRVVGTADVVDADPVAPGVQIGTISPGIFGLYGRIAGSKDVFEFMVNNPTTISFDFDGYTTTDTSVDSVPAITRGAGESGLMGVAAKLPDNVPGNRDNNFSTLTPPKTVVFQLSDGGAINLSQSFTTDINSLNTLSSLIFSVGPGHYTLTVDGTTGANQGSIAFYDLNITPVPLPAAGWMLIAGLGALAGLARKRRAAV